MKKYANYLKEREGMELIESSNGFAVYCLYPETNGLYLAELFVEKPNRGSMEAFRLFQACYNIARENYCDHILGSVDESTNNYKYSEKLMIKLGFHFHKKVGNLIFYKLNLVKP